MSKDFETTLRHEGIKLRQLRQQLKEAEKVISYVLAEKFTEHNSAMGHLNESRDIAREYFLKWRKENEIRN